MFYYVCDSVILLVDKMGRGLVVCEASFNVGYTVHSRVTVLHHVTAQNIIGRMAAAAAVVMVHYLSGVCTRCTLVTRQPTVIVTIQSNCHRLVHALAATRRVRR